VVPVSAPVTGKTGGTGFGLRRTTWHAAPGTEEGRAREGRGDAVMLTLCSVGAAKAGEWRSTCEAKLQAMAAVGEPILAGNRSNGLVEGWRMKLGWYSWKK